MKEKDPEKFAESAGLVYVHEDFPGFTRKRWGRGFIYNDEEGNKVKDTEVLDRIKSLVIPPAWKDVWICQLANGHIQATGYDQKGRKQYLYHDDWLKLRNRKKYDRMLEFGKALPQIRETIEAHKRKRGLPREKVLATVVSLLEEAMIRVGNRTYAKNNDSYGLTTLRKKHMDINGHSINFEFKGKSGKYFQFDIKDRKVTNILKKCNELPGYEIFKYVDEHGEKKYVDSGDVNEYIREISGQYFTAKYFRTWGGSIEALEAYLEMQEEELDKRKNRVTQVVKRVSERLNNTVSICRDYYIHPAVIDLIKEEKKLNPDKFEIKEEYLTPVENYFLRLVKSHKRKVAAEIKNGTSK